jgi:hypothetical protein
MTNNGTSFDESEGEGNSTRYPLLRAQSYCVHCGDNDKPKGLLLHEHCHRYLTRKDGPCSLLLKTKYTP